jgi:MoxR-like ATPase
MDELQPVVSPRELSEAQEAVKNVFVKPALRDYVARIVDSTRSHPDIALGASTRGTLNLFHGAQAWAAINGREYVLPDDIKDLVEPVLAHRLILRPNAEMQGATARKVIAQLLEREPVPQLTGDE